MNANRDGLITVVIGTFFVPQTYKREIFKA